MVDRGRDRPLGPCVVKVLRYWRLSVLLVQRRGMRAVCVVEVRVPIVHQPPRPLRSRDRLLLRAAPGGSIRTCPPRWR